jgi:hypothetical protein
MQKHLAAAILLAATAAHADPRADVMAVVDASLNAINTNDGAMFEKTLLPQAIIIAQSYQADGSLKTRILTPAAMAAIVATPGRTADERLQDPQVLIRNDIAQIWSPYTFDLNGKRLHCGVDSFGLAKVDGRWRIASLTWTAEPNGCPK